MLQLPLYTSSSNLSIRALHLEGEEVFRLAKCKVDLPFGLEADSHRHYHVSFFNLKVANGIPINQLSIMDVGETSSLVQIIPTMV
jgi:hypothetical protein